MNNLPHQYQDLYVRVDGSACLICKEKGDYEDFSKKYSHILKDYPPYFQIVDMHQSESMDDLLQMLVPNVDLDLLHKGLGMFSQMSSAHSKVYGWEWNEDHETIYLDHLL